MTNTTRLGTALVTGASSGIGLVYADRLAHRGYDLILVARNQERLDRLANRLNSTTGRSIKVVAADLGAKKDVRRIEAILSSDESVTMLVNNAGIGGAAPLLDSNVDEMEAMVALNVTSLMRLTYAVAPQFVARGGGTIINISSIVAVAPEVLNGVYGGTKAFVLAFSQSLRAELEGKGVRVQAVLPGATRTEFWDIAGLPVENLQEGSVMTVEDLVDAALAGLDQGEFATVPPLPDVADWNLFESARTALSPKLLNGTPAARYGVHAAS